MIFLLSAGGLAALLVLAWLFAGRTIHSSRTVLLHLPLDAAWERVRDFAALHAAHGRGRPLVHIETTTRFSGDGLTAGSTWRESGRWGGRDYWVEAELVSVMPPRGLVVRLVRDSLGTHRGLVLHRCALRLWAEEDGATKLTFALDARLASPALLLARRLHPDRLGARLLDLCLRAVKVAIDEPMRAPRPAPAAQLEVFPSADSLPPPAPEIAQDRL